MELHKAAPGKHGPAKIKVIGIDLFTQKKYDDIFGSTDSVSLPTVKKTDYQVQFLLDDGYLKLMNLTSGDMREDLNAPEDMAEKVEQLYREAEEDQEGHKCLVVTVLSALGMERIVGASLQGIKPNHAFH